MRADLAALESAAALDLMTRLVCVPVVLGALEVLGLRRELTSGGVLDWRLSSLTLSRRPLDRVLRSPRVRHLLSPRGTVVVGLILAGTAAALAVVPRVWPLAVLALVLHTLLLKRHHQSVEGSDDMILVLLGVSALRGISADPGVQDAAVWFVAGQVALSYLTAGLSKAQGREWWSGAAMPRTMSTLYFGNRHAARLLWRHRWIAVGLSWTTIVWESTFVLCLVAPPQVTLAAVGVALSFHLACAVGMHLGAFGWAFGATYPCVLVTAAHLGGALSGSTRLAVTLGALVLIVGTAGWFAGTAMSGPVRVPVAPRTRRAARVDAVDVALLQLTETLSPPTGLVPPCPPATVRAG